MFGFFNDKQENAELQQQKDPNNQSRRNNSVTSGKNAKSKPAPQSAPNKANRASAATLAGTSDTKSEVATKISEDAKKPVVE
jgi:hypothetical protein